MAVVTVQLGQCGNQLGREFFAALAAEAQAAGGLESGTAESFFRQTGPGGPGAPPRVIARAALVDMEPKVVAAAMRPARAAGWSYDARSAFCAAGGSGNNWAWGYATHGPRCRARIMAAVRREAEASDRLDGFLLLQSVAGGTGAGLGAYVAEALRDDYGPGVGILSHSVWPYESGEVLVQNYNALLTLASLAAAADGVVVTENGSLHAVCARQLGLARPTFLDLNRVAARGLSGLFLPSTVPLGPGVRSVLRPITGITEHLCSHPGYPLLSLIAAPQMPEASRAFTTFAWPPLLKRLRQMAVCGSAVDDALDWGVSPGQSGVHSGVHRALGSLLVLRGPGAAATDCAAFAEPGLYAPWSPMPLRVATSESGLAGLELSATLLTNGRSAAAPVARSLSRARVMLGAGAFVHQYEGHGLGRAELEAAFAAAADVVAHYGAL